MLAATEQVRLREERKLLDSLYRRGLVAEGATLDSILNLTIEDVLGRRLQSMIFKKGMALSPLHARQLIVHRHILIGERRITIPGYGVSREEEGTVRLVGVKGPTGPSASAEASSSVPQPSVAEADALAPK